MPPPPTSKPSDNWRTLDSYLEELPREASEADQDRWVTYDLESVRPPWHLEARCYAMGTDYYFGEENGGITSSIQVVRQASKLCDVCPVFTQCLRWALENREEYGVWAGTSGRARKKIFALLDEQATTVDDVIEVILNGQANHFRRSGRAEFDEPPCEEATQEQSRGATG